MQLSISFLGYQSATIFNLFNVINHNLREIVAPVEDDSRHAKSTHSVLIVAVVAEMWNECIAINE